MVSQAMNGTIVVGVTPESDLVLEDILKTQTRVEMRLHTHQTTETCTLRPWATSWFSSKDCLELSMNIKMFSRLVV